MSTHAVGPAVRIQQLYADVLFDECLIRHDGEPYFQERIVQIAWNEQLFRGPLQTVDGRRLEVVHPGTWNVASGPDFRDAVLFIDGVSHRGPVEVHLRPRNWEQHGHGRDPAYAPVILHVVWEDSAAQVDLPTFCVRDHLRVSLEELIDEHSVVGYPYARQVPAGSWSAQLAELGDEPLHDLFQSYGIARILQKARNIGERVVQQGLDRTVYELLCDAMGYKSNRTAFAELAAMLPLADLNDLRGTTLRAVLFGAAGLLPDPSRVQILPDLESLVQEMWAAWWCRRREFRQIRWHRGQRPYNCPERRLLALSLLLEQTACCPGTWMINVIAKAASGAAALKQLQDGLNFADDRWRSFYTFARRLEKPAALLGRNRVNDMLVNVAIPLFFAWCLLNNRPADCRKGRDLLLAMPRLQNNRQFKEATQFFFVPPSRSRRVVCDACTQQGLLKLYRELARPEDV